MDKCPKREWSVYICEWVFSCLGRVLIAVILVDEWLCIRPPPLFRDCLFQTDKDSFFHPSFKPLFSLATTFTLLPLYEWRLSLRCRGTADSCPEELPLLCWAMGLKNGCFLSPMYKSVHNNIYWWALFKWIVFFCDTAHCVGTLFLYSVSSLSNEHFLKRKYTKSSTFESKPMKYNDENINQLTGDWLKWHDHDHFLTKHHMSDSK